MYIIAYYFDLIKVPWYMITRNTLRTCEDKQVFFYQLQLWGFVCLVLRTIPQICDCCRSKQMP